MKPIILCLTAVLLLCGCTTFNHDWKKAAGQAPQALSGRWIGTWASDATHHTDPLRCVITIKPDGTYRARFKAKYHHVLSFGYTVTLNAEPVANGFKFSGDADLGYLAGGKYHYEGHADGTNFWSTYSCKYDHGTFQMTRP